MFSHPKQKQRQEGMHTSQGESSCQGLCLPPLKNVTAVYVFLQAQVNTIVPWLVVPPRLNKTAQI